MRHAPWTHTGKHCLAAFLPSKYQRGRRAAGRAAALKPLQTLFPNLIPSVQERI